MEADPPSQQVEAASLRRHRQAIELYEKIQEYAAKNVDVTAIAQASFIKSGERPGSLGGVCPDHAMLFLWQLPHLRVGKYHFSRTGRIVGCHSDLTLVVRTISYTCQELLVQI